MRKTLELDAPLDLAWTYAPLGAGSSDPTLQLGRDRVVRATRTPHGPASIEITVDRGAARAELIAHGQGGQWLLERARDLLGCQTPHIEPRPHDSIVARLSRAAAGARLPRAHAVFELLVKIVLEQLVSGAEAKRTFRTLVSKLSEPAPGPHERLMLPVAPRALRELGPARATIMGLHGRKLRTLKEIAWHAERLEALNDAPHVDAERVLLAIKGIGPWSVRSLLLRGLGCADAVIVGDYNLPGVVSFNLTGEREADDARMLELLEPHRGYRGLVTQWIRSAGKKVPRRGPRQPLRPLPTKL